MFLIHLIRILAILGAATAIFGTVHNICNNKPDGTLLPSAFVTFYIRCQSGYGRLIICPSLEIFDIDQQKCRSSYDYTPELVIAHNLPTSTPDSPQNAVQCPCQTTEAPIYLPHPQHFNQFYLCHRSHALPMTCCPGLLWDDTLAQCVPLQRSQYHDPVCAVSQHLECPPMGRHFYPHPKRCESFIYCENGRRAVLQCPTLHDFDWRLRRCVVQSERPLCKSNV